MLLWQANVLPVCELLLTTKAIQQLQDKRAGVLAHTNAFEESDQQG
jgi:hypothetical protein